jgi:Fe2+ transport system protein FeoA
MKLKKRRSDVETPGAQGHGRGCGSGGARLCDCRKGEGVCLARVGGDREFRLRMAEMGFTRGSAVEVVKDAPLGDPVEYKVKGYHLTLRRGQTADITVTDGQEENGQDV